MSDWRDSARERVKEKKAGATFKLQEGLNGFRILPNKKDLLPGGKVSPKGLRHPPYLEVRVHRDVGPDKAFLSCGKDIDGQGKCWLCDKKIPELDAMSNAAKREQAFTIGAREAFIVQVSRVDEKTNKFGLPKPWWVSNGKGIPGRPAKRPTLATQVQSAILNSRKDFVDPEKGYNMYITRTGMGPRDTVYEPPVGDESSSKVPASILDAVKPLTEFIPEYSEEDQKSAYFGRPRREKGEGEEDDRPRRRAAKAEEAEEVEESEEAEEVEEAEEAEEAEEEPEEEAEEEPEEESEEPEEEAEEEPEEEEEEAEEEPEEEAEEEPEEEEEEAEEEPPPAPRRTAPAKKAAPAKKKTAAPVKKGAVPAKKKGKK